MKPSRSKSASLYGATFAYALSHWRQMEDLFQVRPPFSPMIHSRCFALPSDWSLGFKGKRLIFYVSEPCTRMPSVSDTFQGCRASKRAYKNRSTKPLSLLFYLFGYLVGSPFTHRPLVSRATGLNVVGVSQFQWLPLQRWLIFLSRIPFLRCILFFKSVLNIVFIDTMFSIYYDFCNSD